MQRIIQEGHQRWEISKNAIDFRGVYQKAKAGDARGQSGHLKAAKVKFIIIERIGN